MSLWFEILLVLAIFAVPPFIDGWPYEISWPAWIQAVGSVLAIFVAIYISWWQHNRTVEREDRDREIKARSLALAIFPALLVAKIRLKEVRKNFVGQIIVPLEFPIVFAESIDRLYLLGEAGASVQQLWSTANSFNSLAKETITEENLIAIEELLDNLDFNINESIELITPIHDKGATRF